MSDIWEPVKLRPRGEISLTCINSALDQVEIFVDNDEKYLRVWLDKHEIKQLILKLQAIEERMI